MGLFSTKTKSTSKETATTTPNLPSYAQGPVANYYSGVSDFMQNPNAYMPDINSAMASAFGAAGASQQDVNPNRLYLGGGNGGPAGGASSFVGQANPFYADALSRTGAASDAIGQMGPASLTTAGMPTSYDTANVAGIGPRGVTQAQMGNLGPAAMAQAASAGSASQADAQGYNAALVGDPSGYLGKDVERAQAASLLDGFDNYMNPALGQLRDASMANFDDAAGRQQAAYAARGAQAGAFGGSRFGIGEAQMAADLTRNRALTDAELTSNAFNAAAGLANLDAGRRQETGIFNAGQKNALDLARGQMGFQGALSNQGAVNSASAFGANAANTAGMFNAGAKNDFAMQNAGFQQQANITNAGAQNQFGLEAFNAANSLSQFNAGAANDASAQQFGVAAQNAQADAAAENARRSQQYGTEAATSQFNAGQANNMSQFNSQQDLARQAQQLAAAGQIGSLAGQQADNTRADTALQADLGQRLYELQMARSKLGQLQMGGQLIDPSLLGLVTGQTINSEGTSTGKKSGGLGNALLSAGASLGSAAIMASERRVKRDIALLGREPDGLGQYAYRYVTDEPDQPARFGVMVDEVEAIRPWALGPIVDGVQTVDYSMLEAA